MLTYLQVLDLKDYADVVGEAEALSVREGQHLVVIQDAIQILYPLRIHVAVKHYPVPLGFLVPHVVHNLTGL
jgi:hypothetical protein